MPEKGKCESAESCARSAVEQYYGRPLTDREWDSYRETDDAERLCLLDETARALPRRMSAYLEHEFPATLATCRVAAQIAEDEEVVYYTGVARRGIFGTEAPPFATISEARSWVRSELECAQQGSESSTYLDSWRPGQEGDPFGEISLSHKLGIQVCQLLGLALKRCSKAEHDHNKLQRFLQSMVGLRMTIRQVWLPLDGPDTETSGERANRKISHFTVTNMPSCEQQLLPEDEEAFRAVTDSCWH